MSKFTFTTLKTIFVALVLTLSTNQLFAQNNNGIFFQAVARDNFSNPAKDRKIFVQSSIIQSTPTGTKVLTEEHQANTDALGVFSISLGNGTRVGGTAASLATIDWSKGPFYLNLKVAITPIGGSSNWDYTKEWVDMGTTSFGAVPFALYSASSAKVDDKLNVTDTTKMLAVYAKAMSVKTLETAVASKLTAADTLTMLKPYAKAAYTIDSNFFRAQLATKLSLSDSTTAYVTPSQLAGYNFSSGGSNTTTTNVTIDTTSLSNRINLKASQSDLTSLTTSVNANTTSITANTTAINLKAPLVSPNFTGTVSIGTLNPSTSAALEIASTNKGLLLPRLNYVQKNAITSPVAGLLIWCTDCGTNGEMQVYNGTSFVNMVGSQAQFALPSISSTTEANSITTNSALSGGIISSDGGASVSARGVVWGTSSAPTIALTTKTTDGTGIGTFTSSITGLTSGVTYYVRAYATNSVGTKYGSEITLNTAQAVATLAATTTASSIGATTATSGGNITYNGGATVTASGVIWSTSSNPTITLSTKTTDGAATGTYTSSITGLTPGTLYYVRSYATNSVGTSYGAQTSFTTLNTPTISATAYATSITSSTATIGGTITSDGGAAVTTRGVVYGTSTGSATFSVSSGTGTGTYTINLTGLTPATIYFARSFATNSVGTVYGTETSFTTIAIAPTLTTTAASSITKYAASAGGTITSNGGSSITVSGICWSTTATPTTSDSKTTDVVTSGTFTSSITGLTAGTTYFVRAYATNAIGTSYGAAQSFTTLSTPPAQTTVLIGSQRWTDKNLNVANYRNGDPITYAANATDWNAATNAGIGAWSYYNFDATNGLIFGKLYNWYAVNDSRGLAPTGYHIPTKVEYNTLSSNSASSLKSTSSEWGVQIGTNTTGFTGLPGGNNNITSRNQFEDKGTSGWFWSSDVDLSDNSKAYLRLLHRTSGFIEFSVLKLLGASVRLVKDDNSIETSPTNPVLASTTSATSITANSAILGGNVTDEGATQVSVRGLVYGTTTGSSTFSVTIGSGAGTFTSTLTGLSQGTMYYVRSFATNTQGTSYGAETSFTTQTTPTVSVTATPISITTTSAIGGGTISSTGGATITTSGLVWGASTNPEITLTTKTTDGTTSGTFTSSITGLTQGTTYHVRAYATNYLGTSYGPDISFTTITTPTVSSTATVTSITGSTATSGGTITVDGGATVTSRGVVWGTSSGSSTYSVTSGTGTGTYLSNLSGLSIATTYFVRAFATNSAGTTYGPEVQFATPNTATVASTITSTITSSTAILGGVLSSNGGATTTIGIIYSTSSSFGTYSTTTINANAVAGTYTTTISGLSELTTYYVKAFATNTAGTTYGPTINFRTPVLPLTVGTSYQGGKIFYIFQPGESGYVAGQTHGLIAATSDQGSAYWGCYGASLTVSNSLGSGSTNTASIIGSCSDSGTAASKARAHNGGGYSDWYLPSQEELYKLYLVRSDIGGFTNGKYWSSSQAPNGAGNCCYAIYYNFQSATQNTIDWQDKNTSNSGVRAIRTF